MPSFSERSSRELYSCDGLLIMLFETVVRRYDCTVLEGSRTPERQRYLLDIGRSRTLNSKHLHTPSRAVDVAPYPVQWKRVEPWYHFAGYVTAKAEEMGIRVRWGGDWDSDLDLLDQDFNDLAHWEI